MGKIKIGLVLGSGAARGWPHIGAISALKKVGIKIGIVAGCLIGSLVDATYICDRLSALEDWVTSFSYWDVLHLMDFSWQHGGLLRGECVFNQYREVMPEIEVESCPHHSAAVATSSSTGRELWFTEGDFHLVIRASCSIPELTAPVAHNSYQLVDGVIASPTPISLTRTLGADIVIAVDLQHDAYLMQQDLLLFSVSEENSENGDSLSWRACLKEGLNSITTRRTVTIPMTTGIMTTSIQVLGNHLKRSRMTGDPPDILIQPVCP